MITDDLTPTTIDGRFRVLRRLGDGGQGSVFLVDDEESHERRALKLLHGDELPGQRMRERFNREFDICRRLRHPNLVRVHERGLTAEGAAYYTMDFVQGRSLMERLQGDRGLDAMQPMEQRNLLPLLRRVASALHSFPGYAKVRRVALTLDSWDIDNGMLTPTLKLRRREVQQRYADALAALFRH